MDFFFVSEILIFVFVCGSVNKYLFFSDYIYFYNFEIINVFVDLEFFFLEMVGFE